MEKCLRGKSIHWYLVLSWIIPGLFALAASTFIIFAFAWIDLNSERTHKVEALSLDSAAIARKISNEILLGDAGQPLQMAKLLQSEYKLSNLQINPGSPDCNLNPEGFCWRTSNGSLFFDRTVPFVSGATYISASVSLKGFFERINSPMLLLALVPWIFFTLVGLVIQKRFMRAKFMEPMLQLVSVGPQQIKMNASWPTEVSELARRLQDTFDDRDAAIFGQTVRGVVHDIRTRLQPILMAAGIAKDEQDPARKKKALDFLVLCCSDALPKVKSLLDRALDAARGVEVQKELSNLTATVQHAVDHLKPLADSSKVRLEVTAPKNAKVPHDSDQLERALSNLIKNSIEATLDKEIAQRAVRVTLEPSESDVSLTIEDSGNGFTDELIEARTRGLRVVQSTKHHGIGIGLFSARQIIEAHGGELELSRSDDLGGARSRIRLRSAEASQ
jgi:signal transduction histidine kinase